MVDVVTDFIVKHTRRGDCVFDVGANQGVYIEPMLRAVGPHGRVYAFEPNLLLFQELKEKFRNRNVVVENCAISNKTGTRTFYIVTRSSSGSVASSLEILHDLHKQGQVKEIQVSCLPLDAYCGRNAVAPRLIKIDTEGHEPAVIQGARETINGCRPFVIFEFWETWWNRGMRDVFEFLERAYTLVRLQDGKTVSVEYYDRASGEGVVDIACVPG